MRCVIPLIISLALLGCSAKSGVQTWRPVGHDGPPVALHGEFNASNSNVFIYANEERIIADKLHPWERRGVFFGELDGFELRAECVRGKKWLEVCVIYADGEIAATLDFRHR